LAVAQHLPQGRCQAGDRHLNFHETRDNLDVADGARPGQSAAESAELRELKRRNRLLEQENEVLRRAAAYLSQASLPN